MAEEHAGELKRKSRYEGKKKTRFPAVFVFLILLLILSCVYFMVSDPRYSERVLFHEQTGDINYRIPGIVTMDPGTVIAYCEKRKGADDWADMCIAYRISGNLGKTWGEERILAGEGDSYTYNNPVMVVDRQGVVHALYCREYGLEEENGGVFYTKSTDKGRSWSSPENISEGTLPAYRNVIGLGPGHGICLEDGTLIVAVWMIPKEYGQEIHSHHPAVVSTLYSRDGGEHWAMGEILEANDEVPDPSESTLVELSDGSVMLNARNLSEERYRAVSISPDGISGWSDLRLDENLPDPVCFGSLARYGASTILFVNDESKRERENVTVKVSHDDGRTWEIERALAGEAGGYADINVAGKRIFVLTEERDKEGKFLLSIHSFRLK